MDPSQLRRKRRCCAESLLRWDSHPLGVGGRRPPLSLAVTRLPPVLSSFSPLFPRPATTGRLHIRRTLGPSGGGGRASFGGGGSASQTVTRGRVVVCPVEALEGNEGGCPVATGLLDGRLGTDPHPLPEQQEGGGVRNSTGPVLDNSQRGRRSPGADEPRGFAACAATVAVLGADLAPSRCSGDGKRPTGFSARWSAVRTLSSARNDKGKRGRGRGPNPRSLDEAKTARPLSDRLVAAAPAADVWLPQSAR